MTDASERSTPSGDAHLVLLHQIAETQRGHGEKLDEAKDEQHAVKLTLATLTERIQPLLDLPNRLGAIEHRHGQHEIRITGAHATLSDHGARLSNLETLAHQQKGWQGPAGRIFTSIITAVGVLILSAILALVGIRATRAATPPDPRFDAAANTKCYAAPAKQSPKYLYL